MLIAKDKINCALWTLFYEQGSTFRSRIHSWCGPSPRGAMFKEMLSIAKD